MHLHRIQGQALREQRAQGGLIGKESKFIMAYRTRAWTKSAKLTRIGANSFREHLVSNLIGNLTSIFNCA
jgi:hypothetical protein